MADQNSASDRRIVVGVDGSECSKKALAWALRQARSSGARVEAVCTWQEPARYGFSYATAPGVFQGEGLAAVTDKILRETITEVSGPTGGPVDVVPTVVEGPAAMVLLRMAAGAELLVVGGHGHGAFTGMLLGSVSQHCVQHAPCPVVVVPDQVVVPEQVVAPE
jgi:nucleotide-binding universal stress UspA family protein